MTTFLYTGDMCGGASHVSVYLAAGPLRGVTIEPALDSEGYVNAFSNSQFLISHVDGSFRFDVDFGDGSGVVNEVPTDVSHVYTTAGPHMVTVTASDLIGTLLVSINT